MCQRIGLFRAIIGVEGPEYGLIWPVGPFAMENGGTAPRVPVTIILASHSRLDEPNYG